MIEDRLLCGLKVCSELLLSDLPIWEGDDRPPDLSIMLDSVPHWPEAETIWNGHVQVNREGSYRFCVPQVATYCVDATGQKITIEPTPGAITSVVQDFLLGTVLVILCQRRGLWPLHASCVRLGDKAIAFTGPSGAGKSTLAAAFMAQGYEILSDDVTVIDIAAGEGAMVLPSVPRVKLWRNTAIDIGLPVAETANPSQKERLPLDRSFSSMPLPLAAIYYFESMHPSSTTRIQPLRAMKAVHELSKATHRRRLLIDMVGGRSTFLGHVMRITAAIPVHHCLERPLGFAALPDLVTFIVEQEKNRHVQ